jgi:hypothetical protein
MCSKINKKGAFNGTFYSCMVNMNYPFSLSSEDTVSLFLPFALREASTLLPLEVDILFLNPCLFDLFLLDG